VNQRIGITLGDPCGIGPEITVRTLSKYQKEKVKFVIYGNSSLLEETARQMDTSPFWKLEEHSTSNDSVILKTVGPKPPLGGFKKEDLKSRVRATLAMLDAASKDCLEGTLTCLVTGPIDKSVVRTLLPKFTGHTEYLAEKASISKTVMMLDNTELRVVLLTNHIALRDVAKNITEAQFESSVKITAKALSKWFRIDHPQIAVAGINPHAGEIVNDAEEDHILKPVIKKLKSQGYCIEGPFAADSLFPKARNGKWDLLIAAYHDQGLIAAKYPGIDKVVNVTLGLPYLRISPGHGVAYDIAGKGLADTRSFERALRIAITGKLEA